MMESQAQETISSLQKQGRSAYLRQCKEVAQLKLQAAFPKTMWTPLESLHVTIKTKIACRCVCGKTGAPRGLEVVSGKSRCCRSCSSALKMVGVSQEDRIARAKHASNAAVLAAAARVDEYGLAYGWGNIRTVRHILSSAKQRCTNPKIKQYKDYGARGITFDFESVSLGAEWVLDNLGIRPSEQHSIDRIDNNRGYGAGNLRWATYSEQGRNKRAYKRTIAGERIRDILSIRSDITYETARSWIKQQLTDEQIMERCKYARSGV